MSRPKPTAHLRSSFASSSGVSECGRYLDAARTFQERSEVPSSMRICGWCEITRSSEERRRQTELPI